MNVNLPLDSYFVWIMSFPKIIKYFDFSYQLHISCSNYLSETYPSLLANYCEKK